MTDNVSNIFTGGELIFGGSKNNISGGGYDISSFFFEKGMSPLKTYNGGGENTHIKENVSALFENLAVPAGLFYFNARNPSEFFSEPNNCTEKQVSDDIIDKLFNLVEQDNKKKRQTKKHNGRLNTNKRTKKHMKNM